MKKFRHALSFLLVFVMLFSVSVPAFATSSPPENDIQVVLGNEPYTIISINGHFSVDIYNASNECLELLKMLTQQEGLFLKAAK